MHFFDAVKELLQGKFVARVAWAVSGEYVALLPGMQYLWKIMHQPNPAAGNWIPLMEDMLAADWAVVDKAAAAAAVPVIDAVAAA